MTRGAIRPEPRRLVTDDPDLGPVLRIAEEAFRSGLNPNPAWQRFQQQRQRRRWLSFAAAPMAALIFAGLLLVAHRALRPTEATANLVVTPERLPIPEPSGEPPPAPPAVLERRISPPTPLPRPAVLRAPKSSAPALVAAESDTHCRSLVSEGSTELAVACFLTLGRQSGLGAEVALYEAARLAAEGLHDTSRALTVLDEHAARFPKTVLHVEVAWLRIRCLERDGRLAEALSVSEALLDAPGGRSLAAKLHLLRGRIYADAQGDCARAVREYVALLGEPGPTGDDAEFRRAQCLEQLGHASEARAAYERYLGRSDALRAARAQERLNALSTSAPSLKGDL